jgi:hypothetical protein
MPEVPWETLTPLLAMCEGVAGPERTRWIVIPPVIFLAWGLFVWACVWRDTESRERGSLLGLMVVCAVTGGFVFLFPGGVSGNGDYLLRFWISVLLAGGIGLAWPFMTNHTLSWRSIGAAIAGDVAVPGGLILMFFWALALSGSCID